MLLSTDVIAERNRVEYWREIVCGRFVEVECETPRERRFYGSIDTHDRGQIRLCRIDSAAQRIVRTSANITRSDQEFYFLSLQLQGRGCHKQGGRVGYLGPGDFVIFDTTQPYELLFADAFSQLVLSLPRAMVNRRLPDAERLTACAVPGCTGTGRLASVFVQQLATQMSSLDAASLPTVQVTMIDLIAVALAERRRQADPTLSASRNVLTQRVLQFIEDHLGDPDLTCGKIAERHRISGRYLRALFHELAVSPSDWIWRRRLERARQDLVDSRKGCLPITTICFRWGFKDAAHFSRAFKAQFGCTPSEARANDPLSPA